MRKSKDIITNILVCGYLREQQYNITLHIPEVITTLISFYCKKYIIQIIGSREQSIKCADFNVIIPKFNPLQYLEKIGCKQIYDILFNKNDKIIDIASGSNHHLLLTLKGNVYGIGSNRCGQLGLKQNIKQIQTPMLIPFNDKIKAISCGKLHSLFINKYGKLLVCGYNYCGQLGIIPTDYSEDTAANIDSDSEYIDSDSDYSDSDNNPFINLTQTQVIFQPIYNKYFEKLNIRFKAINCGLHSSLCITTNGECFTFGHNSLGNLGNGEISEWGTGTYMPYKLNLKDKFTKSACGKNYNILLNENNEIIVFGDNRHNQCSSMEEHKILANPYILSKEKK
eukprot:12685_1